MEGYKMQNYKMQEEKKSTSYLAKLGDNLLNKAIDSGWELLRSNIQSTIVASVWDPFYFKLNKIIHDLNPMEYEKHIIPNTDGYDLSNNSKFSFVNKKYKVFIIVHKYTQENTYLEWLVITIYGKGKDLLRNKIIRSIHENDKAKARFYNTKNSQSFDISITSFHNILLKKGVQRRIISGLYKWKNDEQWYKDHNLIHKIGILLYGKPGTGKSTVVRAISQLFGSAPIISCNIFDMSTSVDKIIYYRQKIKGVMIVLLEDFDFGFSNNTENDTDEVVTLDNNETEQMTASYIDKPKKKKRRSQNENQQLVFQLLDGIYSTDDTIYIATTNHIEQLDEALIRSGRFDIREELEYFNEEDAISFVKYFGYDGSILDSFNIKEYPIQPAKLQAMLIAYRSEQK